MSVETDLPPFGAELPGASRRDGGDRSALVADWTAWAGQSMGPVWRRFGALHKALYLASGGRVGHELLTIPMLLLSTRGRRSGLVRTMPLAYLPDPEDPTTCVTVASNGGSAKAPASWLNLTAEPRATVQVGTDHYWVRAEEAPRERRDALWQALRASIPPYRVYERIEREIPIVLLRRIPAEERVFDANARPA